MKNVTVSACQHTGSCSLKVNILFICTRNRCMAYAACIYIYVTFSTFNVLNVFAAFQRRRQVNFII